MPKPSTNHQYEALKKAVSENNIEVTAAILMAAENRLLNENLSTLTRGLLDLAITNNNEEMVSLLLKHRASLNEENSRSETPLIRATKEMKWNIVKLILNSPAAPKLSVDELKITFYEAIENDNLEIITLLLHHKFDLIKSRVRTNTNKTMMALAAYLEKWNIVNLIASTKNTDVEDTYQYNRALYYAVDENKLETVKILLNANAKVTWRGYVNKYTALHRAVRNGNLKIAQLLIEYGADVTAKDSNGETPLALAIRKNNWDMVNLINVEWEKFSKRKAVLNSIDKISKLIEMNNRLITSINRTKILKQEASDSRLSTISNNYRDALTILSNALHEKVNEANKLPEDITLTKTYDALFDIIQKLNKHNYKYPSAEVIANILKLCSQKSPLIQTIAAFFTQIQTVSTYTDRIREILSTMKVEIAHNTWTRTNFLGQVKRGTPKHIKALEIELAKTNNCVIDEHYFNLLNRVHNILSNATRKNKRNRVRSTQDFYTSNLRTIEALSLQKTEFKIEEILKTDPIEQVDTADSGQSVVAQVDTVVTANANTSTSQIDIDSSEQQYSPPEPSAPPPDDEIIEEPINQIADYPPPAYSSLYPSLRVPVSSASNMYPVVQMSDRQDQTQEMSFAQPQYIQESSELLKKCRELCPEYVLPIVPEETFASQPEQLPASSTQNVRQSTAKILQVVGTPVKNVEVEHIPPSVHVENAPGETEDEKHVRLTLEELAKAPRVPKITINKSSQIASSEKDAHKAKRLFA